MTMLLAHNGTCTMYCNLLTDIRVARETGYKGIEIVGSKLYRYLDQGYGLESVQAALDGFPVVGLGYVQDIERQEPGERDALFEECEKMCSLAEQLGSPLVQLVTGPIGPGIGEPVPDSYRKIVEMPWPELRRQTARNLAELSAIGAGHDLDFYLEPVSWTPIHGLQRGLELLDAAGVDNIGLMIDFWHMSTRGVVPDDLAKLDKDLLRCAHYCDSLAGDGSSHADREVWTGGGIIPLKEWVDAMLSTGFDGWWSCELFSERHWELDPWKTARLLREQLEYLLV